MGDTDSDPRFLKSAFRPPELGQGNRRTRKKFQPLRSN